MKRLPKISIDALSGRQTPLYAELRDEIRGFIATSSEGALLPTERTLASAFGVSRITVRRAIQDLKAEGLVDSRRSQGTFVTRTPNPQTKAASA